MGYLGPYLPRLAAGLLMTCGIAAASIVLAAAVAVVLGALRAGRGAAPRVTGGAAVEFLRGTSVLVQLFWVYYALPAIPGAPGLTPTVAAVLVLGLNGGAYGAEIVRDGIRSVPPGQLDASHALGLPGPVRLFRVVLPQAIGQIVPAFGSIAVDMVKWTSVVSFVTVQDLFYVANAIRVDTNHTVTVYIGLGLCYVLLSVVTALLFRAIEFVLPVSRARRRVAAPDPVDRVPVAGGAR